MTALFLNCLVFITNNEDVIDNEFDDNVISRVSQEEVANYHRSTDEDKNVFWLKTFNKELLDISYEQRVSMINTSKLVEKYIAASQLEKDIIWSYYDPISQLYCNYEKACNQIKMRIALNMPKSNWTYQKEFQINHTLNLMKEYNALNDYDKHITWHSYDMLTQLYCDRERFCDKYIK